MDFPHQPSKIRIGAVSYLNTKPLVYRLQELVPAAELVFDLPSRLATGLAQGTYDVALIPSIELLQDPSYSIVSDACIACRGPVWSVKLLTRKPFDQIRSLALDEGSRTSVALVRILLWKRFGLDPQLAPLPLDTDPRDVDTDAVLVIGDRAMHAPCDGFTGQWDLGDEWCRWAELPFVFAMWTARAGCELTGLESALSEARDLGVAHLDEIARETCDSVGLTHDQCMRYLRDHLYFYLGEREQRGLECFFRHAADRGLAPRGNSWTRNVCTTS